MSRRSALFAIVVMLILLVGANLAVHHLASNSVPRQVMRSIDTAPATIGVLGLGNSLVAAGFDASALEQTFREAGRPVAAVNGGLGATGVIEHLALARLAFDRHRVEIVVYGFFDQQMFSDFYHKNSDLIGNHTMLYYQEPELTLRYAPFDPLERAAFQVIRCCDLLIERSTIWVKVEMIRRRMGEIGLPVQETNKFGRSADFNLLESANRDVFVRQCRAVIESGNILAPPVQALLQQARQHGARVIIVEMPMHPAHLRNFYDEPIWNEFRTMTRAAVERAGATYLNASEWIPERHLFEDHLHLSKVGAAQFTRLLARRLLN